ncbi:MAG: hypothetical protein JWN46_1265 [Acidimicrobiales bacterium]|nr:hypothetical protein [Acidimicrobiales bacterium]
MLAAALLGAGVISVLAGGNDGPRRDTQGQLTEQGGAKPHIIPLPNSGHAPSGPGDRGGWEQLLTLGLIVGGIALLAALAWRGARKARAGRQAWLDAATDPPTGDQHPAAASPGAARPPPSS